MLYSILALALAALASIPVLSYLAGRVAGQSPYPPGPKPLPVIGNLLDVPRLYSWLTYASWAKTYGDVLSFRVGNQHIVILTSASAAREICEKPIYCNRPDIPIFGDRLMGWTWMAQLCAYGDKLHAQRRVLQSGMRAGALIQHRPMFEAKVHDFLERLKETPGELTMHLDKLQGAILMSLTYGYEIKSDGDLLATAQEAGQLALRVALPGALLVNHLPILQYLPNWFPGTGFRKLAERGRELGQAMRDSPVAFVKESMAKGIAQPSIARDALESLNTAGPDSKPSAVTEQALRDACGSLYLAGFDTVVATLHKFFLVLALNPGVQRKAQAEVDAVTGRTRLPTFEDQPHLPYIEALCKELTRWQPVAPLLFPRSVERDDTYRGYFIPKGSIVMTNAWALLQDPERFPEPDSFKPERFLTGDNLQKKETEDIINGAGFGFGRRHCPGRYVSEAIIFMTLVSVLATFDVGKAKNEHGEDIPISGKCSGDPVRSVKHLIQQFHQADGPQSTRGIPVLHHTASVNGVDAEWSIARLLGLNFCTPCTSLGSFPGLLLFTGPCRS
ncbi:cytochrome P450 [Auriscalpium vulgare]|uniref:Cytochrome P450 n=1 Tax=Auriscalpium vulgare TaxID=40419 RepID=A0ACB8RD26_9AGAM|nr:cytochrome P450 [Auriscalpium vulgare]